MERGAVGSRRQGHGPPAAGPAGPRQVLRWLVPVILGILVLLAAVRAKAGIVLRLEAVAGTADVRVRWASDGGVEPFALLRREVELGAVTFVLPLDPVADVQSPGSRAGRRCSPTSRPHATARQPGRATSP